MSFAQDRHVRYHGDDRDLLYLRGPSLSIPPLQEAIRRIGPLRWLPIEADSSQSYMH